MQITREQMSHMRTAKSPEELGDMLRGYGLDMPQEKVRMAFEAYHSKGEMSDEELMNVAGGVNWLCEFARRIPAGPYIP